MRTHPYADLFPLMDDASLQQLADDILRKGLREAVWIHPDGRIVDGRNRWLACQRIGIKPRCRVLLMTADDQIAAFIVRENLHRHSLSMAERVMIASRLATRLPNMATGSGLTRAAAAELLDVKLSYVQRLRVVQRDAPHFINQILAGDITIDRAFRLATGAQLPPLPKLTTTERYQRIAELAAEGWTSEQIAAELKLSAKYCRDLIAERRIDCPGDRVRRISKRPDPIRILDHVVMTAEGLTADEGLIDLSAVPQAKAAEYLANLQEARTALTRFINRLARIAMTQEHVSDDDNTTAAAESQSPVTAEAEGSRRADREDPGTASLPDATAIHSNAG